MAHQSLLDLAQRIQRESAADLARIRPHLPELERAANFVAASRDLLRAQQAVACVRIPPDVLAFIRTIQLPHEEDHDDVC